MHMTADQRHPPRHRRPQDAPQGHVDGWQLRLLLAIHGVERRRVPGPPGHQGRNLAARRRLRLGAARAHRRAPGRARDRRRHRHQLHPRCARPRGCRRTRRALRRGRRRGPALRRCQLRRGRQHLRRDVRAAPGTWSRPSCCACAGPAARLPWPTGRRKGSSDRCSRPSRASSRLRACPRRSSGETRASCASGLAPVSPDLRLTRVNYRFDYPVCAGRASWSSSASTTGRRRAHLPRSARPTGRRFAPTLVDLWTSHNQSKEPGARSSTPSICRSPAFAHDTPEVDGRARAPRRRVAGCGRHAGEIRGGRRGRVSRDRHARRRRPLSRTSSPATRSIPGRRRSRRSARRNCAPPRRCWACATCRCSTIGDQHLDAAEPREVIADIVWHLRRGPPGRRRHLRPGRRVRTSRSHRDLSVHDGGHRRGGRSRVSAATRPGRARSARGVEAVLHRVAGIDVGRLPGRVQDAGLHAWTASNGRRRRGRTGRSRR